MLKAAAKSQETAQKPKFLDSPLQRIRNRQPHRVKRPCIAAIFAAATADADTLQPYRYAG